MHMSSPALQSSCLLVALEGVGSQCGSITPQSRLLQCCNTLLWQPCAHTTLLLGSDLGIGCRICPVQARTICAADL